jgi:hypothetical protein
MDADSPPIDQRDGVSEHTAAPPATRRPDHNCKVYQGTQHRANKRDP